MFDTDQWSWLAAVDASRQCPPVWFVYCNVGSWWHDRLVESELRGWPHHFEHGDQKWPAMIGGECFSWTVKQNSRASQMTHMMSPGVEGQFTLRTANIRGTFSTWSMSFSFCCLSPPSLPVNAVGCSQQPVSANHWGSTSMAVIPVKRHNPGPRPFCSIDSANHFSFYVCCDSDNGFVRKFGSHTRQSKQALFVNFLGGISERD